MSAITITGNLSREPELRFTASGRAGANLAVAENHRVRGGEGEWTGGPTTCWPVTVWGETAEHVAEVVAEEVTPSLRWATAKLTKAVRSAGQPDVAWRRRAAVLTVPVAPPGIARGHRSTPGLGSGCRDWSDQ